ncbi:MAG: hypothetical protein JWN66_3546 [Sphingomonas bacterium]|uniref:DUF4169 family protein n=1 Tax=Sphingomonas bacterium TaxID=1895847 RepID=UPI00262E1B39|nr:DUF4169 family protein [Sphingomonas bacterium]MDB5706430.1 hypothetical protein [Sphingomonas bacterium]
MADIINLRSARKARARAEKDAAASANRQLFGQTREEKRAVRDEQERVARLLDGAKRTPERD